MNPAQVKVGIQAKGSATVADMRILGELIGPDLGIELKAISEDDQTQRLEWLQRGDLDLMYEGFENPTHFEGNQPGEISRWRGPFQIRVVASAHSGVFGFMVSGDSPLTTIYDITHQTRVAESSNSRLPVKALGHWLGFGQASSTPSQTQEKDSLNRVFYATWEGNVKSVLNREADVAYVSAEHPLVRQAAGRPPGIRFLELPVSTDPAGAGRFQTLAPNLVLAEAPPESPPEVAGLTTVLGSANLWCRDDFDAALAYRLTEWFDSNFERFRGLGNKLGTYSLAALLDNVDRAMAPVHAGTLRYLDEKGLWTDALARRQAYNGRLLDLYCAAWGQALDRAGTRAVTAAADNPAWIQLWHEVKAEINLPRLRRRSDAETSEGLQWLAAVPGQTVPRGLL
jgi:uncharacterized protein